MMKHFLRIIHEFLLFVAETLFITEGSFWREKKSISKSINYSINQSIYSSILFPTITEVFSGGLKLVPVLLSEGVIFLPNFLRDRRFVQLQIALELRVAAVEEELESGLLEQVVEGFHATRHLAHGQVARQLGRKQREDHPKVEDPEQAHQTQGWERKSLVKSID